MTTKLVQARISKKIYSKLENKCSEYGWEINIALIKLIEEWVDMDGIEDHGFVKLFI